MKTNEITGKVSKKVYNLMIVDESGSMTFIQKQALAGINETMEVCRRMQTEHPEMAQYMTIISFDSDHFKFHYDGVPVSETRPLTKKDYVPSGATPLYDAIGKGIAKLNAQTDVDDNVLVTIISDGEENCSSEYDLGMVKNLIEKCKKLGWTFTFIGTDNLDVKGMAESMAIDNHLEFVEDEDGTKEMFAKEHASRRRFMKCCLDDVDMPRGSYFDE